MKFFFIICKGHGIKNGLYKPGFLNVLEISLAAEKSKSLNVTAVATTEHLPSLYFLVKLSFLLIFPY